MPKPRIAITLGDPAGIGPEIVSDALRDPRIWRVCEPIVVGDPVALALHGKPLPKRDLFPTPGLTDKFKLGEPSREAGVSAIQALEAGLDLVRLRQASALVTSPVSKESFRMADHGFPGHTEWLAEKCGVSKIAMLMVSGSLRTILMTRHIPIAQVSKQLTVSVIRDSARLGFEFVKTTLKQNPRIILCGLNPHAGDNGLIGKEEQTIFLPAIRALNKEGIRLSGPIASDYVFPRMARGQYDLALAAYHDQGMIPLKLYAAERMVNITLGLPFVRTSPAHGTAYDIAGKGKADPRPTIEAILLAARYTAVESRG